MAEAIIDRVLERGRFIELRAALGLDLPDSDPGPLSLRIEQIARRGRLRLPALDLAHRHGEHGDGEEQGQDGQGDQHRARQAVELIREAGMEVWKALEKHTVVGPGVDAGAQALYGVVPLSSVLPTLEESTWPLV